MARMAKSGKSLKELASVMTVLPQVLINVPVSDKSSIMRLATLAPQGRIQVEQVQAEIERLKWLWSEEPFSDGLWFGANIELSSIFLYNSASFNLLQGVLHTPLF